MHIKKKLIAISLICAMAASFSACSDKNNSSKSAGVPEAPEATLSSEEIQSLQKQELTITPFKASDDNSQDPVENSDSSSNAAGNNDSQADNNNNNNNSTADGNNSNSGVSSIDASDLINTTDVVILPGKTDDSSEGGSQGGAISGDNTVIAGKKEVLQAYWMDISKGKNFVFDGEFIKANFKVKEGTAPGTYPVTVEWLDFSNWNGEDVAFSGINGSVVVGSEAKENSFKNDGTPEIKADNVSGNAGDTVTVSFNMKNNPGIVACIFRFGYDSDALEYVGGDSGKDFTGTFN